MLSLFHKKLTSLRVGPMKLFGRGMQAVRQIVAAIVGQGADVSSRDVIRDGTWVGSTAYFPESYANYLIPNIIRLINGEEVPDPILVEHVFIDQTNIDEYYPE